MKCALQAKAIKDGEEKQWDHQDEGQKASSTAPECRKESSEKQAFLNTELRWERCYWTRGETEAEKSSPTKLSGCGRLSTQNHWSEEMLKSGQVLQAPQIQQIQRVRAQIHLSTWA